MGIVRRRGSSAGDAVSCLNKMDGDAAVKQKLYAQISRLDPVQALECAR